MELLLFLLIFQESNVVGIQDLMQIIFLNIFSIRYLCSLRPRPLTLEQSPLDLSRGSGSWGWWVTSRQHCWARDACLGKYSPPIGQFWSPDLHTTLSLVNSGQNSHLLLAAGARPRTPTAPAASCSTTLARRSSTPGT